MKVKAGSSKSKKTKKPTDKGGKMKMPKPSKDMSVRVEEIENGFLITKEGNESNGWKSVKRYSETNPLEGI